MSTITSIIIGLILVAAGLFFVLKTEWFVQNFGSVAWAEQHLGYEGGTRLFYKLIGIVMILIGFLFITGLFGSFIRGTIGSLFVRPGQQL